MKAEMKRWLTDKCECTNILESGEWKINKKTLTYEHWSQKNNAGKEPLLQK